MGRRFDVSKERLAELYKTHTYKEVAEIVGFDDEVVRKWLHKYGIKTRRPGSVREFNPKKKELSDLYQKMSMRKVALHYGVGETVVWKRLKEFGIALRDYEDGGHRKKPGRQFSAEHRKNLSEARLRLGLKGEKSPVWKGGASITNLIERRTGAYKAWKRQVIERHEFKCAECGVKHGAECKCCGHKTWLHAHHLEEFAGATEKRFDPANGVALCSRCHASRHKR